MRLTVLGLGLGDKGYRSPPPPPPLPPTPLKQSQSHAQPVGMRMLHAKLQWGGRGRPVPLGLKFASASCQTDAVGCPTCPIGPPDTFAGFLRPPDPFLGPCLGPTLPCVGRPGCRGRARKRLQLSEVYQIYKSCS